MRLPFGKIPLSVLERVVFKYLGVKRGDVILGPSIGEDAAIIKVNGRLLAASCDPISGAEERIGWLAVNVAANDVATRGVKPSWFLSCIMLPEGFSEDALRRICMQMDRAAQNLGMSIIGGHAEVTPGLTHPLVIGSALGVVEGKRYVTCSGAKPKGKIILTKGAGIEGTAILASDRRAPLAKKFGEDFVKDAEKFFEKISVLEDAQTALKFGGVWAMHDPTEGGVSGGLHEMADASKTGFKVYEDKIIVEPETIKICEFFEINPLQLISSGSLLIVADPKTSSGITAQLERRGIKASIIGDVLEDTNVRVIVRKNGLKENLARPVSDDLWTALTKKFDLDMYPT